MQLYNTYEFMYRLSQSKAQLNKAYSFSVSCIDLTVKTW